MPGIDETRRFIPVNIAILTVSDTRTEADDKSGKVLLERVEQAGHRLAAYVILPDDKQKLVAKMKEWAADLTVDVVLTTGGTGLTGRDVTPEAMQEVCEKEIPGFGELFRQLSFKLIGTSTIQSRAMGGVAGGTYFFAIPGSPGACKDAWDLILKDQFDNRYRPCNFVEIMPRLREQ